MAIDATVGGASSNSYATLAEADAYFAAGLRADTWDSYAPNKKEAALLEAAADLDLEIYLGSKTDTDQALKFPRASIRDVDGNLLADDAIPQNVKSAQCELAFVKLSDPDSLEVDGLARYKQISLGQGEIDVTPRQGQPTLPSKVMRLLGNLINNSIRAVRS